MDREDTFGKLGLKPEIDTKSGFCYGVIRAIKQSENYLAGNSKLYSLGAIVHNSNELLRLEEKGMKVIGHNDIEKIDDAALFIRAHGEPPSTYESARRRGLEIVDCTCPVVLKLQERIRKGYAAIKAQGGLLLIFGKKGHAEVNGLVGQVGGDAVIIEKLSDLEVVDFKKPLVIFSQTTKDPAEYSSVVSHIKMKIAEAGGPLEKFICHNTICRQVSSRHPHLKQFAQKHSVIIFVSGVESSNGKVLFETCNSVNKRSYKIEQVSEIDREWFSSGDTVGICGATSTPMWQLEEVCEFLKKL